MNEQELRDELARVTEERDDARAEASSAGIDAEEIAALRASNATAEEALAAVETRLVESEDARALTTFSTKRDKAIKELGLPEDHPAIPLAFPDDTVLDDGAFTSALESLTKIAALSPPPPPPPPPPPELDPEIEPKPGEWDEFRGPRSGDGAPPSELTQEERRTAAARAKYTESRNPRDLAAGGLGNKIMRIIMRKTPGGQPFYEKERVQ